MKTHNGMMSQLRNGVMPQLHNGVLRIMYATHDYNDHPTAHMVEVRGVRKGVKVEVRGGCVSVRVRIG